MINYDVSLINYFINASLVVKLVMLILIIASIFSWSYILQRRFYLRRIQNATDRFEKAFAANADLSQLYTQINYAHKDADDGVQAIFQAGYKEFSRFRKSGIALNDYVVNNTKRAMHAQQIKEQNKLEDHLPFLAIVSSVSPYVGLFGTVWGIMQAFRALANVQQATIAMVAPGIAEALIATALGLFAAIPATIAYNRFISNIGGLISRFDAFQEELLNLLIRYSYSSPIHAVPANAAHPAQAQAPAPAQAPAQAPLSSPSSSATFSEMVDTNNNTDMFVE